MIDVNSLVRLPVLVGGLDNLCDVMQFLQELLQGLGMRVVEVGAQQSAARLSRLVTRTVPRQYC
jgi:hypothetical protein